MKINNLTVTSNFFDKIDENSAHCELGGCIRLVHLSQTNYSTIEDLQTAIEALIFE